MKETEMFLDKGTMKETGNFLEKNRKYYEKNKKRTQKVAWSWYRRLYEE